MDSFIKSLIISSSGIFIPFCDYKNLSLKLSRRETAQRLIGRLSALLGGKHFMTYMSLLIHFVCRILVFPSRFPLRKKLFNRLQLVRDLCAHMPEVIGESLVLYERIVRQLIGVAPGRTKQSY
jgi:hypothetical protein